MRQPSVVKVSRPLTGGGPWLICDRSRALNLYMEPEGIPLTVQRALPDSGIGYFQALYDGSSVVFGDPVRGEAW